MGSNRLEDLNRFYLLMDALVSKCGNTRLLADCSGRMIWPARGVYFFREEGERRSDSGNGPRVVRIGTHALTATSQTTLWKRLFQHKGQAKSLSGNHRGSIFRLLVGTAIMEAQGLNVETWGQGNNAPKDVREKEQELEMLVSKAIGEMPFMWLAVDDSPGPDSRRGYIERNSIALLSNYGKPLLDAPSDRWLGHRCNRKKVRDSGLWNQNHVDEEYDPAFLDELERQIEKMERNS